LSAGWDPSDHIDRAADALLEVLEVERLGFGEPLGGELAGLLIPADAVTPIRAAPVMAELEGVAAAA
jgi:hypothetical protein